MDRICDENRECKIRLDAARDAVALSSVRLKDAILSGPEEAIAYADASLRLARVRLLAARTNCLKDCQLGL
jgi:hypothetical protein